MADPLFPAGLGIVSLVIGGFVDIRSPLPFTILEGVVFVGALFWYYRHCRVYPQVAPLLAMFPLFFAWRSQPAYFMNMDLLVLAAVMQEEASVQVEGEAAPAAGPV